MQCGHAALAVRLGPVVGHADAHAESFGGPLLLQTAQHQFDRLRSLFPVG